MYKKLLNEKSPNFGGVGGFVISLRREISIWKAVTFLLCVFVIAFFALKSASKLKNKFEDDVIDTKQIKLLTQNVIAEVRIEGRIEPNIELDRLFEAIYKSEKIKGLLVVIDSVGGSPFAAEVLHSKIKKIREKMPVNVFVEGVCASAGYMIAIAAEKIFAIRSGLIGSIGVYSYDFDFTGLMEKIGIGYNLYASSEFKGSGIPYRKMTEKQKIQEQEMVMQFYDVFKSTVQQDRNLTNEELEKVANAKVFIGELALKLKLIDGIGTKDIALENIRSKLEDSGMQNLPVQEIKEYSKKPDLFNVSSVFSKAFSYIKNTLAYSRFSTVTN